MHLLMPERRTDEDPMLGHAALGTVKPRKQRLPAALQIERGTLDLINTRSVIRRERL